GTCAEAGAIAAMVAAGGRVISEIWVVADSPTPIAPCGGCRQKLAEFATPDTPVILAGLDGERARTSVGALLPAAFGAAHMEGRETMTSDSDTRNTALRALVCLDLTNLDPAADAAAIDTLCARAQTRHG